MDDSARHGDATARNRTPYFAWNDASAVARGRAVIVGFKLDRWSVFLIIANHERTAPILRIAFGITDVQHFVQCNWGFAHRAQLLDLTQDEVHIVESTGTLDRT